MTRRAYILLALGGVAVGLLLVMVFWKPREASSVPPDAFIAWAKQHAIPIKTAEAGHGFDDLQPLKQIVGKARVVGMGEATHGTREFFNSSIGCLNFSSRKWASRHLPSKPVFLMLPT